ncbi:hypothetical protein MLD38_001266 [Melastoma candidum]|uniref:Uncharacterized protein n=1 Tax=Melastoma candidum TaxID=119954 RepID=A0ACB9SCR1_9MYRT|nr:hypothetical protein MLD38_001266 [Melastoma candidum]
MLLLEEISWVQLLSIWVAGEKPEDVYSGIAARVLDMMQRDARKDPEIKRRLKERGAILDDSDIFGASCYAAKVTLAALGEMFEAARSIMAWLGECAKIIASENQPVRWNTPLGLPVVQPYRRVGRHLVRTSLQILSLQRETDKVLVQRQRTAFPPNFVALPRWFSHDDDRGCCKEARLTFAGVHDSYRDSLKRLPYWSPCPMLGYCIALPRSTLLQASFQLSTMKPGEEVFCTGGLSEAEALDPLCARELVEIR